MNANTQTKLASPTGPINWHQITRFNFTYALAGGAWLEDSSGYRNWYPWQIMEDKLGSTWIERQLRKQGEMTGHWIDCV